MKNLKIKFATLLGVLVIFSSCENEKIEQTNTEEPNAGIITIDEPGQNKDGFVYSVGYSNKFNYFHNGVKLTDEKQINEMLGKAVHVFHNEENIDICSTKSEEQAFKLKNGIVSKAQNQVFKKDIKYELFKSTGIVRTGLGDATYSALKPGAVSFRNTGTKPLFILVFFKQINQAPGTDGTVVSFAIGAKRFLKVTKAPGSVPGFSDVKYFDSHEILLNRPF